MPHPRARSVVLALAAGALLVTGCSGGPAAAPSGAPSAQQTPSRPAAPPSPPGCPAPRPATFTWPEPVPQDLPIPPGSVLGEVTPQAGGLTLVRFSTSQSIRDGVLYLVKELPKAGYTLGRGDAEASEADAPFVKGSTRGVMRILATGQCQTDWILAIATNGDAATGTTPLLPPAPDASPLPFG